MESTWPKGSDDDYTPSDVICDKSPTKISPIKIFQHLLLHGVWWWILMLEISENNTYKSIKLAQ